MGDVPEILLAGPGDAKRALKSFLQQHRPERAARIMGMVAMDHPGDAEIVAAARRFFARADRIAPAPD
jgi:hypothetical protein